MTHTELSRFFSSAADLPAPLQQTRNRMFQGGDFRQAAMLLAVVQHEAQWQILLTRRADIMGPYANGRLTGGLAIAATAAVLACRKQRDGKTLQQWQGGWQSGSAFASYLHVHFAQRPTMLNHWLRAARRAL